MLEKYNSLDEIKESKIQLTKLSNKLQKKAYKLGESLHLLTTKANKDFDYDDKSELKSAVWHFHSYHPFYKSILNNPENIKIIESKYPELALEAQKVFNNLKPLALEVKELTEHIESETARLKGNTVQQLLESSLKSKDLAEANKVAISKYFKTLDNWKESHIENGDIIVNGVNIGKKATVGVIVGRGARVHKMEIYVGVHTDEKTKIESEKIFIVNQTQWRRSSLVILDIVENIPDDVFSKRA